jgi:hypothetical protein
MYFMKALEVCRHHHLIANQAVLIGAVLFNHSFPPPASGECRHRGLARRSIALRQGVRVSLPCQGSAAAAAGPARTSVDRTFCDVRFTPKSGHRELGSICPLCAKSRHLQCSKFALYSITSPARASSVDKRRC